MLVGAFRMGSEAVRCFSTQHSPGSQEALAHGCCVALTTYVTLEVATSLGPQSSSGKMGVLTLSSGHGLKTLRVKHFYVSGPPLRFQMYKLIQSSRLSFVVGTTSNPIYR